MTLVFAIIALALSGNLCDRYYYCSDYPFTSSVHHGASGVGITAGVFGMMFGILAILWLLISELWDVGLLRFILVIGFALTCIFAFVSGVIFAYLGGSGQAFFVYSTNAAASAFEFLLMLSSGAAAVLCWIAKGGGTAST